jgi:opacity protein-like surface antigen
MINKKSKVMNSLQRRYYNLLATSVVLAFSALPTVAQIPWVTEPLRREGISEIYGIGQYLHSDDINFEGPYGDVKTKMNDTGLGGFGFAYHFSDFFSVHGDFMFGSATFSGNAPVTPNTTIGFKQDAFIQTGRFNVDYNIINRRLTPFVTAGIGYQYLETELNHGSVTTCWWDPWWGWVCDTDHVHAWETDFTWNVGGGLRWNVLDGLVVKAMAGATWLEYSGAHGITTQLEGIFSIGWSF